MSKIFIVVVFIVAVLASVYAGWYIGTSNRAKTIDSALRVTRPRPLARYEIEKLRGSSHQVRDDRGSGDDIGVRDDGEMEIDRNNNIFTYKFDPTLGGGEQKTMTGQIMIPDGDGPFPLVLMIRGFVSQEIYQTGIGTSRVAQRLSEAGFITLAPDFLGYGGSDSESGNIFETRFQTYTTVLSLLANLGGVQDWDGENIFIWAHSNGGQVALTALAVNGEEIPTVLWAPVSKPFPYSILYYTDEAADGGKFLRRGLAEFEADYDTDLFSFDKYLGNVRASFQIHQGGGDDAIPLAWTNSLVKELEKQSLQVEYFVYPRADHNMVPDWEVAVDRTIEFFGK